MTTAAVNATPAGQVLEPRQSPKCLPDTMSLNVTPERRQFFGSPASTAPSPGHMSVSPSPIPRNTVIGSAASAETMQFPLGKGASGGSAEEFLAQRTSGGRRSGEEAGLSSESRSPTVSSGDKRSTQSGSTGRRSASTPVAVRETAVGVGGVVLFPKGTPSTDEKSKRKSVSQDKDTAAAEAKNSLSASHAVRVSPSPSTTKKPSDRPPLPPAVDEEPKCDTRLAFDSGNHSADAKPHVPPRRTSTPNTVSKSSKKAVADSTSTKKRTPVGTTPTPSRVLYASDSPASPSYPRPYRALELPSGRSTRISIRSDSNTQHDTDSATVNSTAHENQSCMRGRGGSAQREDKENERRDASWTTPLKKIPKPANARSAAAAPTYVPRPVPRKQTQSTAGRPPFRSKSANDASTRNESQNQSDMSTLARSNPHLSQLVDLLDNKVFTEEDVLLELEAIRQRSLLTSAPFNRHLLPILAFYLLKEKFGEQTATRYVEILKRPFTEAEKRANKRCNDAGAATGARGLAGKFSETTTSIPSFLPRVNEIRRERRENKEFVRVARPHLYTITPPYPQSGPQSSRSPNMTTATSTTTATSARSPRRSQPHYSLMDDSNTLPSSSVPSPTPDSHRARSAQPPPRPYRGYTTYTEERAAQDKKANISDNDYSVLAVSVINNVADRSEAAGLRSTGISAFPSEIRVITRNPSEERTNMEGIMGTDAEGATGRHGEQPVDGPAPLPWPAAWPPQMRRVGSPGAGSEGRGSPVPDEPAGYSMLTPGVSQIPMAEDSRSQSRSDAGEEAPAGFSALLSASSARHARRAASEPPRGNGSSCPSALFTSLQNGGRSSPASGEPTNGTFENISAIYQQPQRLPTADASSAFFFRQDDTRNASMATVSTKAPDTRRSQHSTSDASQVTSALGADYSAFHVPTPSGTYDTMTYSALSGGAYSTATSPRGPTTGASSKGSRSPSVMGRTMTYDDVSLFQSQPSSPRGGGDTYGSLMKDSSGHYRELLSSAPFEPSALPANSTGGGTRDMYGSLLPGNESSRMTQEQQYSMFHTRSHNTTGNYDGSLFHPDSHSRLNPPSKDHTQDTSAVGYGSVLGGTQQEGSTMSRMDASREYPHEGTGYSSMMQATGTRIGMSNDSSRFSARSRGPNGQYSQLSGALDSMMDRTRTGADASSVDEATAANGSGYGSLLKGMDATGLERDPANPTLSLSGHTGDQSISSNNGRQDGSGYGSLLADARGRSASSARSRPTSRSCSQPRGSSRASTARGPSRRSNMSGNTTRGESGYGSLLAGGDKASAMASQNWTRQCGNGYGSLMERSSMQHHSGAPDMGYSALHSHLANSAMGPGYGSLLPGHAGTFGSRTSSRDSSVYSVGHNSYQVGVGHGSLMHDTSARPGFGSVLQLSAIRSRDSSRNTSRHSSYQSHGSHISSAQHTYGSAMAMSRNGPGSAAAGSYVSSGFGGGGYGSAMRPPSTAGQPSQNYGSMMQASGMPPHRSGIYAPSYSLLHGVDGSHAQETSLHHPQHHSGSKGGGVYGSLMLSHNGSREEEYSAFANGSLQQQRARDMPQSAIGMGSLLESSAGAKRPRSEGGPSGYGSMLHVTRNGDGYSAISVGTNKGGEDEVSGVGGYSAFHTQNMSARPGDYGSVMMLDATGASRHQGDQSAMSQSLNQSIRYGSMIRHSRCNESEAAVYSMLNASADTQHLPEEQKSQLARNPVVQNKVRQLARLFEQQMQEESEYILSRTHTGPRSEGFRQSRLSASGATMLSGYGSMLHLSNASNGHSLLADTQNHAAGAGNNHSRNSGASSHRSVAPGDYGSVLQPPSVLMQSETTGIKNGTGHKSGTYSALSASQSSANGKRYSHLNESEAAVYSFVDASAHLCTLPEPQKQALARDTTVQNRVRDLAQRFEQTAKAETQRLLSAVKVALPTKRSVSPRTIEPSMDWYNNTSLMTGKQHEVSAPAANTHGGSSRTEGSIQYGSMLQGTRDGSNTNVDSAAYSLLNGSLGEVFSTKGASARTAAPRRSGNSNFSGDQAFKTGDYGSMLHVTKSAVGYSALESGARGSGVAKTAVLQSGLDANQSAKTGDYGSFLHVTKSDAGYSLLDAPKAEGSQSSHPRPPSQSRSNSIRSGDYGSALHVTMSTAGYSLLDQTNQGKRGGLPMRHPATGSAVNDSSLLQGRPPAANGDDYSALQFSGNGWDGKLSEASLAEQSLRYGSMVQHSRLNQSEAAVYSLINASVEMRALPEPEKEAIAKDTTVQNRVRDLARRFEQQATQENLNALYPTTSAAGAAANRKTPAAQTRPVNFSFNIHSTAASAQASVLENTGSQFGYSVFMGEAPPEHRPRLPFLLSDNEIKQILTNKRLDEAIAAGASPVREDSQNVANHQEECANVDGKNSNRQSKDSANSEAEKTGASSNFNESAFFDAMARLQISLGSHEKMDLQAAAAEKQRKRTSPKTLEPTEKSTPVNPIERNPGLDSHVAVDPDIPATPSPKVQQTANKEASPEENKREPTPPESDAKRDAAYQRTNVFSVLADVEASAPPASPAVKDGNAKRGIGFRVNQRAASPSTAGAFSMIDGRGTPSPTAAAAKTRPRRTAARNDDTNTSALKGQPPSPTYGERSTNVTVLSEPVEDDDNAAHSNRGPLAEFTVEASPAAKGKGRTTAAKTQPVSIMMHTSTIADASYVASPAAGAGKAEDKLKATPQTIPRPRSRTPEVQPGADSVHMNATDFTALHNASVSPANVTTNGGRTFGGGAGREGNKSIDLPLDFTRDVLGADRCRDETDMGTGAGHLTHRQEHTLDAETPTKGDANDEVSLAPLLTDKGNGAYEVRDISILNVSMENYTRCADLTAVLQQSRIDGTALSHEDERNASHNVTPPRQIQGKTAARLEEIGGSPFLPANKSELNTPSPVPPNRGDGSPTNVFTDMTPESHRGPSMSPDARDTPNATRVDEEGSTLIVASAPPRRQVVEQRPSPVMRPPQRHEGLPPARQPQRQPAPRTGPHGGGQYLGMRPAKPTILHIPDIVYVVTPEPSPDVDRRRSLRKEREHDEFVARWAMRGLLWKRQEEQAQLWEERQAALAAQQQQQQQYGRVGGVPPPNYYNNYHAGHAYRGPNVAVPVHGPPGQFPGHANGPFPAAARGRPVLNVNNMGGGRPPLGPPHPRR